MTYPAAGSAPGPAIGPAAGHTPLRVPPAQWATAAATLVGFAGYALSLLLDWAVAGDSRHTLIGLVTESSRITSGLFAAYLLLPLVAYALANAAGLGPASRRWPRTGAAALAALLGAGTLVWLAVRFHAASAQLELGLGWYAGLVAVLAACVAAATSTARSEVGGS